MSENIKDLAETFMLRGCFTTAEETPDESPLQVLLLLADRQVNRPNNHEAVQAAANEELG